ncbi:variable large family protein [Borrelia persica]|uniref:variable large family protein n=1 Tax=Borrelia persica TaxID=44448 RepID=UPI0004B8AF86|nr:variable large family protein [Borrelia persica]
MGGIKGKMKKIIKRSLLIMMILGVMGCGQQVTEEKGKSLNEVLIDVGRSAENVFYSFLELVSGTLGFTVTKDTKKSEVGDYFNSLGKKIASASEELEQVAVKATADVDKDGGILNKTIRSAVDSAKKTLGVLKGHLDSLKDIGDSDKVGVAVSQSQGVASAEPALKRAYNAFQGIVDTAGKEGVEKPKSGETAVKVNSADNKDGVKILATDQGPGTAVGEKAAAILSIVNGEEMLASVVASGENDQALGGSDADGSTSTLKFALGGNKDNLAKDSAKAAAVAGGIALRSLVKGGKLAGHSNDDDKVAQLVGISAVNKLLGAVEEIVKKTVNNVLEKAKGEIDKARAGKPAVLESNQ